MLNIEKLKGHIPDGVIAQIPDVQAKFEINTPLRLAHFLAQCGHESGGFKAVSENLNYGAKGLSTIFKKYFTPESAKEFERKPEKIANVVYANRMGNGPQASGEGWKFRGRGYLQITGKSNYSALTKDTGIDFLENPDLIATTYPLMTAGWFFKKNNLFILCDKGATREVVESVTKRVNGGLIGIEDRWKHFQEFNKLLAG
jgi:putative chitinase